MESLRLLQLFQFVFSSLFDVQSKNYHQDYKTNPQQCKNTLQDYLAGCDEELDFPIIRLIQGRWNHKDLRVGNGLWPPPALLCESNLNKINEIWRSTET